MNLPTHYTKNNLALQVLFSSSKEKMRSLLPDNLHVLLQQSACVKRFRGISSSLDLLWGVLLYAVSGMSFSLLSTAMASLGITSISDTAWKKRFSSLSPFLELLLSNLLSRLLPTLPEKKNSRSVFLVDATTIRQQGKEQTQQRVHLCYSLNENRMQQLLVTDSHTAESLSHFSMKKGDIFLADAGYGTAKNYAYAMEQQADVMLRISPNHFCVYDAEGTKIDWLSFLKEKKGEKDSVKELFGFVSYQKKSYPVRVIAAKLPKEKAEQARKRKRRKASKNQYQLQEKSVLFAGYMIVITSLGVEYGREEIVELYRMRWQIELLFKRWKQNLKIQTIRAGKEKYAQTLLYAWLILWILTEQQAIRIERYWYEKEEKGKRKGDLWKLSQSCFLKIKGLLELSWSLFAGEENETVKQYVIRKKRRRINQNEEFHRSILPSFIS